MKTDRELLELAAKAAGYETWWGRGHQDEMLFMRLKNPDSTGKCSGIGWNPLTDDGDALRLAVKLRLAVHVWDDAETVSVAKTLPDGEDPSPTSGDWHSADVHACGGIEAATRRAIVRAAAAIGEGMQ